MPISIPSIPNMLGAENQRPTSPDGTHMAPIMAYGLATNSIGYLVTDDNAMVWRADGQQGADADVAGDNVAGSRLSGARYAAGHR